MPRAKLRTIVVLLGMVPSLHGGPLRAGDARSGDPPRGDLTRYSFSWRALVNRFRANRGVVPRWMNLLRSVSTEGFGRLRYYREIRRRLDRDPEFGPYFAQASARLPRFYADLVRKDLGPLWDWLPDGALALGLRLPPCPR